MTLSSTPTPDSGNASTVSRKRGARACDACRAQRSRCSGNSPTCHRCQRLNIPCHYTLSVRQYRAEGRQSSKSVTPIQDYCRHDGQYEANNAVQSTPTTASETVTSPATSAAERLDGYGCTLWCTIPRTNGRRYLGVERTTIRQHIDAYFEYVYPVPILSFLHRADFLGQYTTGTVYPALLLAVCAISSRFLPPAKERSIQVKSWVEQAETILFQSLGKWNIESVQALMMLAMCHGHSYHNGKTFQYLALAVRTAFALKLHKEDDGLSFVERECRRRLLWCMFTLDRFQAGGIIVRIHPSFIHALPGKPSDYH